MAPINDDRMLLGQLKASMETLINAQRENRDEGRHRDGKLEKIVNEIQTVNERLRDQKREAEDSERRFNVALRDVKHSQAQSAQILTTGLELVNLHIKKLEAQADATTGQVASLATEQSAIRTDVAAVKADTQRLQVPVTQLVGIRKAIIAWGGALCAVTGFLFWLFWPLWEDFLRHFTRVAGL